MQKKYLVTGGLGFIGSHLADLLLADPFSEVYVIDDLSTGRLGNMSKGRYAGTRKRKMPRYHLVDIRNSASLFFNHKFDCVIHLAAWARVQRSVDDPVGTNAVNVDGTLQLLQNCRDFGVKNFIYASSSSVYGKQETHIMTEDLPKRPLSPYALQKLHGEQWGEMYASLFGINFTALRFFNVYGPRQLINGPYSLVIGKFFHQKQNSSKLTVFGDGTQTRAYTYVKDTVLGILSAIDSGLTGFNAFNIGSEQETSVNEIAKLIGGEVEHIIPNPRGNFEEQRKVADCTKAKQMLKWEPETPIDIGIKITGKSDA